MNAGVENLRSSPQHTEHEQNAYKRWQVGDSLKDWYEDEATHTEEEDGLTLTSGEPVSLFYDYGILLYLQIAFQRE